MLDRIFVDYFGTPTALNQIARVSTSGAQQLVIEPFDKSVCKEIEKAISNSDLNLTANNDGTGIIRINVSDKRSLLYCCAREIPSPWNSMQYSPMTDLMISHL